MSKTYEKLDTLIISAISKSTVDPMFNRDVTFEAQRIAKATGRDDMRVIDGRLIALSKSGAIRHFTKSEAPGNKAGWYVMSTEEST